LLARRRGSASLVERYRSIPELFEEVVDRAGGSCALEDGEGELSYGELEARANRLARYLRELGVERGSGVGILLGREREQVVALLAVLKCGGWYVPLDPQTPVKRVGKVLSASGVKHVISRQAQVSALVESGWEGEWVLVDRDAAEIERCEGSRLGEEVRSGSAAYVIYTSGSTGEPKGVCVSHGSVHNYVKGIEKRLGVSGGGSYAALSTVGADLGYTTVYGALLGGGRLRLLGEELKLDARKLSEELRARPVSVLKIVPSHLRALLQAEESGDWLPEVLVLGGERLEWELVKRIREKRSGCRIFNHYGPTETTVGVLCGEVGESEEAGAVPLGEPLPGVQAQVLDRWLEPVVEGGVGELYVGGECLALGYWGSSRQTAERFVAHPHAVRAGERMYRTGDRVRVGEDGSLYFVGRTDEQLKIRGHRVEPNEIVEVLRGAPGVVDAAVLCEGERIYGYVTGEVKGDLTQWLAQRLPEVMRPERIEVLESLPLNANGKLDRGALAQRVREEEPRAVQGPRDDTERALHGIWCELLRREQIGIHDNFFDCGGNSLLLIQAHAAIRERLACELNVVDLFHYSTIAKLARRLDGPPGALEGIAAPARAMKTAGFRDVMRRSENASPTVL
ncbi:MAG TPA: non-ribosomal peptide synthetase, partial [Polyangiaceae bacterium]